MTGEPNVNFAEETEDSAITGPFAIGAIALAAAIACVGVLTLAGWWLDLETLKRLIPGTVAMNPATALCFIIAALALGLHIEMKASPASAPHRVIARTLGMVVAGVGVLRLAGYWLEVEIGVDHLLFSAKVEQELLSPNRMAPNTAINFVLLGLSVVLIDVKWRRMRPALWLTLAVAASSTLAVLGYCYGVPSLYGVGEYIPMALHTAAAFLALSIAVLFSRPRHGIMRLISAPDFAGLTVRRLLPAVILIPPVLGGLRVWGQNLELYGTAFGTALNTIASIILLVTIVLWTASLIQQADLKRRQVEKSISQYSAEVHDLYNNAPCGYHSLDPSGTFIAMNDTELKWLGYEREEVIGRKTMSDLLAPASRAHFAEQYPKFMRDGFVKGLEFQMVRKNGSMMSVLLNASAVRDPQGRYLCSRSTIYDITDRQRADAAERRSLEESIKAMEQAIGVIGHELRTPLAGLRAMSECLMEETGMDGQTEPPVNWHMTVREEAAPSMTINSHAANFIKSINDEVSRMSNMVNNMLEAARLNSGAAKWNWSEFSIAQVCRAAAAVVTPLIDHTQVRLECAVEPPDLGMRGDHDAIARLVVNLLSNAQKNTARGRILVTARMLESRDLPGTTRREPFFSGHESCVEIIVADTGRGMTADTASKLGSAFALNAGVIGHGPARGCGLGLAICKSIVAAHGGCISVASLPGSGTRVRIVLRADLPAACEVGETNILREAMA